MRGAERVAVGLLCVAIPAAEPTQDRQSRAAGRYPAGPCSPPGRYGAPRTHAELRADGQTVGRRRIERVMRQHGIRARAPRRYRVCTTDSKHSLPVAPNLLDQNFVDITYIATGEGWLYQRQLRMPSSAPPIAQHRGCDPELRCDLVQRPPAARQQRHRFPLETHL